MTTVIFGRSPAGDDAGVAMSDRTFLVPAGTEFLRDQYHFSQGVRVGDTIWVSGQGGFDESFGIGETTEAQARQAFRNIARVLAEAGASLDDVVEVTSFHVDMAEIGAVLAAAREAFPRHRPAWTAVGVAALVLPAMRVEIRATAVVRR